MKSRVLVRHPAPYPTESFVGYMLRLSEANGYPTVQYMFGDSGGLRVGNRSDLALVARITHQKITDLKRIAYHSSSRKTHMLLGHPVSMSEVTTRRAPVCPRCVHEEGFLSAHFSLRLMTICPKHKMLIKVCPGCTKAMT